MLGATLSMGCESSSTGSEAKPKKSGRFAAAKRDPRSAATKSFCEVSHAAGEGAPRYVVPASKPIPAGGNVPDLQPTGGWRWVNLWATWCRPCIEEIGLLSRWQESLKKDGVPLALELWSVDDDAAALEGWLKKTRMPGEVKWLKGGAEDLPTVLMSLGVDKNAPIPVHALVDPNGALRCVRTGSVHDDDYASIKAILTAG